MKAMISARLFGILSALLLATGVLALWLASDNNRASASAPPPAPLAVQPMSDASALVAPPAPSAKSREEKRFARADRDDDGLVSQAEFLSARRRNYDKLDSNADGKLSFEEYAAVGIAKFSVADSDGNAALVAAEYESTAPKPKKPVQTAANCVCAPPQVAAADD